MAPRSTSRREAARARRPSPEAPLDGGEVRAMFDRIAPRYDLLNTLLSFGADRAWRRAACREALAGHPQDLLDVATGTGALALTLAASRPGARVVGVDVAERMLSRARVKAARGDLAVELLEADGSDLPFADGRFDAVTIAFGLRNFTDRARGLREFRRVLRPGGRLVVLEFPPPPAGAFGSLFRAYFRHVLPRVGGWISGDARAYRYLPDSVSRFPAPHRLDEDLRSAGFAAVRHRLLTFGISALHVADAPPEEGRS